MVKISYFTINQLTMVGTTFEWQKEGNGAAAGAAMDPHALSERQRAPLGAREGGGGVRRQRCVHSNALAHARTALHPQLTPSR